MFTIGIFSTHIPYIAFVLFYAYFFVAGINKAVSGEIPSGEDFHKTEIYASDNFMDQDIDTYHYFCKESDFCKTFKDEDSLLKRKINYPEYSLAKIAIEYYLIHFNKPPPVLV
ncbi:hypothetical protein [Maribellus maritimus]|uniref:hypothetical protein n=1 Tax=Maribellus maritimus TaxID=2870838 RepID=UPI001EEBEEAC|nr:hypothetical protein [Maribellus maritimus]MCG6187192.1 hypothetical protein [Maribellus maritimus]